MKMYSGFDKRTKEYKYKWHERRKIWFLDWTEEQKF